MLERVVGKLSCSCNTAPGKGIPVRFEANMEKTQEKMNLRSKD
jgi:hypothetical protein